MEWGDVNPDSWSKSSRTPLSWAAENGHKGTVKLLLRREDVSPDCLSKSGQTPLSWAAGNGCERVVKQLLGWQALERVWMELYCERGKGRKVNAGKGGTKFSMSCQFRR